MNYTHLTINKRIVIAQLKSTGFSLRKITKMIQRNPSTISRELNRNSYKTGRNLNTNIYNPVNTQRKYVKNKSRCGRTMIYDQDTINYVQNKIETYWSPEQIYNRIVPGIQIPSTSSIYRMIHSKQLSQIQMKNLRRKGKFKRPAETRGKFNDGGRTLKKRPKEIYKRLELGHWEGDTIESGRNDHIRKSNYCFVTLVERKSRFAIAILVKDRTSKNVTPAIINALKGYPKDLVKTITFDRGKEFSGYKEIEKELNFDTYFCDPYCSWQKGTNENTNGLLIEFYPKGMDLSEVDIEDLHTKLDLLNSRPRKCLKYKTANEVINE